MKRIVVTENECLGCHLCEKVCSEINFGIKDISKSCIKIIKSGVDKDINLCTQCGDCIDICPVQAIYRDEDGIIRINNETCVGCLMCVGFCKENAMHFHEDCVEPFKCIACGKCVEVCPAGVLKIEK